MTTWWLHKPIPERLRMSLLHELSDAELCCLQDILQQGWQMNASVPEGTDWRNFELQWVAPLEHKTILR